MRVLLVDDDPEVRLAFRAALTRRGHEVATAASVGAAVTALGAARPDACIVDVMLPDGDGVALCRRIRAEFDIPTLLLTARDADADIVGGLEAGADDYIVKPVGAAVLEARLRAIVRRAAPAAAGEEREVLEVGGLRVDEAQGEVAADGRPLDCPPTEVRLLAELMRSSGATLGRDTLVDRVWRDSPPDTARVVDTTVQRLRARLAAAGVTSPSIVTVRGFGYRLR